jgi:uncharacterized protein YecT (DUF1311 family)
MRPLRVSLALAISLVLGAVACADGTSAESAAAHARDSSLAHDLQLAGDSAAASRAFAGRDTEEVTESPGMLDSSAGGAAPRAQDGSAARTATDAPDAAPPSADGYIGPSCASPARDDQQRCLLGYLAKSDAALDRSYQALITRLKAEAGTKAKTSEPVAVQRLRNSQRAWLVYRDDECRKRAIDREGPLWAPVRAKCLAEYSALRSRELEDALAKRRALVPLEQPKKAKRSARKTTTRHRAGRGR